MTTVTPQALVEHALATTTSEQCVVIVQDSTSANLRWANNTLTTNGVVHGVAVTVIAFHGAGNASVTGTAASAEQVTALVEQADAGARVAEAAEDRATSAGLWPRTGRNRRPGPPSRSSASSPERSVTSSSGPTPSAGSSTDSSTTR